MGRKYWVNAVNEMRSETPTIDDCIFAIEQGSKPNSCGHGTYTVIRRTISPSVVLCVDTHSLECPITSCYLDCGILKEEDPTTTEITDNTKPYMLNPPRADLKDEKIIIQPVPEEKYATITEQLRKLGVSNRINFPNLKNMIDTMAARLVMYKGDVLFDEQYHN